MVMLYGTHRLEQTCYLPSHIAKASAWSTGNVDASGDVSSEGKKVKVENAWMTGRLKLTVGNVGWNQLQPFSIATCFPGFLIKKKPFLNHGNFCQPAELKMLKQRTYSTYSTYNPPIHQSICHSLASVLLGNLRIDVDMSGSAWGTSCTLRPSGNSTWTHQIYPL